MGFDGTGETGPMYCHRCFAPMYGCHCACSAEIARLRAELAEARATIRCATYIHEIYQENKTAIDAARGEGE